MTQPWVQSRRFSSGGSESNSDCEFLRLQPRKFPWTEWVITVSIHRPLMSSEMDKGNGNRLCVGLVPDSPQSLQKIKLRVKSSASKPTLRNLWESENQKQLCVNEIRVSTRADPGEVLWGWVLHSKNFKFSFFSAVFSKRRPEKRISFGVKMGSLVPMTELSYFCIWQHILAKNPGSALLGVATEHRIKQFKGSATTQYFTSRSGTNPQQIPNLHRAFTSRFQTRSQSKFSKKLHCEYLAVGGYSCDWYRIDCLHVKLQRIVNTTRCGCTFKHASLAYRVSRHKGAAHLAHTSALRAHPLSAAHIAQYATYQRHQFSISYEISE